jgi:hypothetical protein
MSISGTDLKFIASERMVDDDSSVAGVGGGGAMGSVIVDGIENNAFPDVMPTDRVTGVEQFRRLFLGALSNDNDVLASAYVGLSECPSDPNVEIVLVSGRPADGTADHYNSGYFTNSRAGSESQHGIPAVAGALSRARDAGAEHGDLAGTATRRTAATT